MLVTRTQQAGVWVVGLVSEGLQAERAPRVSSPVTSLSLPTEFCENLSADCRENVIMTQILPCIKVTGSLVGGVEHA